MEDKPWQLQLVRRSLKKKEKLNLLDKHFQVDPNSLVLDLGCAQGILSYYLRQKGGRWWSVDHDFENLEASREVLKTNLLQIEPGPLPFRDASFDQVISLDYLEHLDDDDSCLREIHRILKMGGELLVATPRTGKIYILYKLGNLLGMRLEFYGHKRQGYTLKDLREKLEKSGFQFTRNRSFTRFISEFVELVLNFFYIKFFSAKTPSGKRDGHIKPSTSEEFAARKKAFHLYTFIYPVIWLITRLDKLLFFQRGYGLMVWAKKK